MTITSTAELKQVQFRVSEMSNNRRSSITSETQVRRLVRWLLGAQDTEAQGEAIEPIMSIGDD